MNILHNLQMCQVFFNIFLLFNNNNMLQMVKSKKMDFLRDYHLYSSDFF